MNPMLWNWTSQILGANVLLWSEILTWHISPNFQPEKLGPLFLALKAAGASGDRSSQSSDAIPVPPILIFLYVVIFIFFFFYWLYNPEWVLVCSTILFHFFLSSTFALQPTIFIPFRSSSTWSIHLNMGLPAGLDLYGVHSVIFLVVLVFSILITGLHNSVFVIL